MHDGIHKFRVVENVTPRAMRIMDLYIQGIGPKDIAERLDMEKRSVSAIINAPNFQHALSIRRGIREDKQDDEALRSDKEVAQVLKEKAIEAAETMIGIMKDGKNDSIRMRAAADILDRVGPSKQKQGNISQQAVVVIGDEAARLINETLSLDMGEIVDVIEPARPRIYPRVCNQRGSDREQEDDRGNDEVAHSELSSWTEP